MRLGRRRGRWLSLLGCVAMLIAVCTGNAQSRNHADRNGPSDGRDEVLVYTAAFAEQFELDPGQAQTLEDDLLALRVIWQPSTDEGLPPTPKLQLYLAAGIALNWPDDEGVWVNHRSHTRRGLLGFAKHITDSDEAFNRSQYAEFFNRVLVLGEQSYATQVIDQYVRKLVPGIQALQFGQLLGDIQPPYSVLIYTGRTPSSDRINRVIENPADYAQEGFVSFVLPAAIAQALRGEAATGSR